jgi:hypothetical protein
VHPNPKNQVTSKESIINSYAWYFKPFQVNFHVLPFKNPSNTSHFVPLFLAHEDVVDGFVIFHTKLSTPQLGSFIFSSLILQGSWSDHYNLKKKKNEKSTPPWYVKVGRHPMESVSHGLRKEKGGEECQAIKGHQCAN